MTGSVLRERLSDTSTSGSAHAIGVKNNTSLLFLSRRQDSHNSRITCYVIDRPRRPPDSYRAAPHAK